MTETNHALIDDWIDFIRTYHDTRGGDTTSDIGDLAEKYPHSRMSLTVDSDELYRHDAPSDGSDELADAILDAPSKILDYGREALNQYDLPVDISLDRARIRLGNLQAVDARAQVSVAGAIHRDGQLAVVEGQVARVSEEEAYLTEVAYECQRCGTYTRVPSAADEIREPAECRGCERNGPFRIDYDKSEKCYCQKVRLQQPPEEIDGDSQPAKMEMLIKGGDLCNVLTPGDRAYIAAHLKRKQKEDNENKKSARFTVWGDVKDIEKKETDFTDLEITRDEKEEFEEIAADNPAETLVKSIKPSHHGHELIKEAFLYQMFGGVEKENEDGSRIRGQSHMFMIGDPGLDKSGLLKYLIDVTPRSIFAVGNNSSKAGLTCAAVRDDWGESEWTIRGGALVKANGGLCAVDEFDKMDEADMKGMNEALSDGTVSPAKAGLSKISLPARTSVVAAANPEGGRFDEYEPIGEQVDFDPTVLSRFDLIFTMKDTVDEGSDRELAGHILDVNEETGKLMAGLEYETDGGASVSAPVLPPEKIQKYVAYAREEYKPVLTDEAKDLLEDFYVRVRQKGAGDDKPIPITARKIEAMIRLSEACARMHLSETVEADHAMRIIDVMRKSLQQIGVDPESGEMDADMVETGKSKTQRERRKLIQNVVEELEDSTDNGAPKTEVIKKCVERGVNTAKVKDEIQLLKHEEGELYAPKDGHLRTSF